MSCTVSEPDYIFLIVPKFTSQARLTTTTTEREAGRTMTSASTQTNRVYMRMFLCADVYVLHHHGIVSIVLGVFMKVLILGMMGCGVELMNRIIRCTCSRGRWYF